MSTWDRNRTGKRRSMTTARLTLKLLRNVPHGSGNTSIGKRLWNKHELRKQILMNSAMIAIDEAKTPWASAGWMTEFDHFLFTLNEQPGVNDCDVSWTAPKIEPDDRWRIDLPQICGSLLTGGRFGPQRVGRRST